MQPYRLTKAARARRGEIASLVAIFVMAWALMPGHASSHREAPLIAQDPMADNTDVYAWRNADEPDKVTLIANFVPLQKPDGGPNFYGFDPNVVYEIHVDNNADAVEDITFQWRFTTEVRNPGTFLYNTGVVTSIDDPDLNVRQFYRLVRIDGPRRTGTVTELTGRLPAAPPNIGSRSTPELRQHRRRHPATPWRDSRVRRPARRRLLRRSRRVRSARHWRGPVRGQHGRASTSARWRSRCRSAR